MKGKTVINEQRNIRDIQIWSANTNSHIITQDLE